VIASSFFSSAIYSVVGPYMAEIWPTRLRVSGMGLAYGTGNFGKIISPLGLALILGANDLIKPAANLESLGLAFSYFAFWFVLGALAFWLIGVETRGRTFEEMDSSLGRPATAPAQPVAHPAGD
jgi:putative MFS transporter